ncbi:hypothetical protein BDA99DRAFT_510834 [Phascolomyces articulosus]|uniref:Uncharacterized protein n=1 Tax=Phascolomyces articulosus TaxID=60185 RepID=A0AAD5JZR1_9FUNG|nr:hypothetical protein BDA99DRAFT_510834 [Phascolomyces articulosus]
MVALAPIDVSVYSHHRRANFRIVKKKTFDFPLCTLKTMQEIPGYYFDEVKKRFFKIMPSGPHSLASIKKRKQEAEQNRIRKIDNGKKSRFKPPPLPNSLCDQNVLAYLRSRRLCNKIMTRHIIRLKNSNMQPLASTSSMAFDNNNTTMNTGLRALYKNLHTTNRLNLPGSPLSRACCMDFHQGDAVICYPQRCPMRFKYQCDPFFTMWNTHFPAHTGADITSLHLGRQLVRYQEDEWRQPLYGTTEMSSQDSKAQLWRITMPRLAEMDQELAAFLRDQHNNYITTPSNRNNIPVIIDSNNNSETTIIKDCIFSLRRNNFWTCSVDDMNHSIVVGCDTGAYMLTPTFNVLGRVTSRASILASSCIPDRPGVAWLGCRDSNIKLFDPRIHSQKQLCFQHSSLAISHLKALDRYRLLAVDVGESLAIWDTRYIPKYKRLNRPLRWLKGHRNDAGTKVACDVDVTGQLLALAGDDHRVRIWSLSDTCQQQAAPFWESHKFGEEGPVQSLKFIDDPPPMADTWNHLQSAPEDRQNRAPGLVVAAPVINHTSRAVSSSSGIHWLTF